MVGLNEVGVVLFVMLFINLFRVKFIVSLVVIFVIGKLVVFEVNVEECDICGFILMIIMWLFFGLILN